MKPMVAINITPLKSAYTEENNLPAYMVLPYKSIINLVNQLPVTLAELATIKGMGKSKLNKFGPAIVEIISAYCEENQIERAQIEIIVKEKKKKPEKGETQRQSFELFRSGKTIEEIAKERGFAVSTIEGHLSHYVGTGEIDIYSVVPKEKAERISEYFLQNKTLSLVEARSALGDDVSYGDIRFVLKHLEFSRS